MKDVVLEDRTVPTLKDPWDVRVHVAQTGICGSDVHYWQRGRIGGKLSARWIIRLGKRLIVFLNRLHSELAYRPRPRELWHRRRGWFCRQKP